MQSDLKSIPVKTAHLTWVGDTTTLQNDPSWQFYFLLPSQKQELSTVRPRIISCEKSEKAQCRCSLVQIKLLLCQAPPQPCL